MKIRVKDKLHFFWMTIILLVLLAIMFAGYIRVVIPSANSEKCIVNGLPSSGRIAVESLREDSEITISGIVGTVEVVGLPVYCTAENDNSEITVVIKEGEKVLASNSYKFNDTEKDYFELPLEKPLKADRNTELTVQIVDEGNYVEGTGELGIAKWNIPQTTVYENGEKSDYDIALAVYGGTNSYLIPLFWIVFSVLLILYIILCCGLQKWGWKPEHIFVILGVGIGILYTFVWTPYSCPDEYAHFSTVYYYSSELLNEPTLNDEGNVLARAEDLRITPHESNSRKYAYSLYEDWNYTAETDELVSLEHDPLPNILPAAYIPQIIAVTLVRLFGLGNVVMWILGRMLALAFYLVLGYFAIKFIPFAKRAMMILLLGVSSLQQAASFSYDCVMNACAFLFVGYLLYLAYEKDKITVIDWVLLFALSIIFAPIKIIYVVMIFAVFLIPNYKIAANKIKALCLKIALILSNCLVVFALRMSNIAAISTESSVVTDGRVQQGYDLVTILKNPLKVIVLWADTLRVKPVDYLRHMFGGVESANGVSISWTIIMGFFILLAFALILEKSEKVIDMKGKIIGVSISVILLAILFLVFTMEKNCTDLTSQFIMGIQGRYFFPFLPLLFPAMQSKNIIAEKTIRAQLAIGVYAMQFLAVCSILEITAGR